MHLLTPEGITQKVQLAANFLCCKEREFEDLRSETRVCVQSLPRAILGPGSLITAAPVGETPL